MAAKKTNTEWHEEATLEGRVAAFKDQFKEALFNTKIGFAFFAGKAIATGQPSAQQLEKQDKLHQTEHFLEHFLSVNPTVTAADVTDVIKFRDGLYDAAKEEQSKGNNPRNLLAGHAAFAVVVEELQTPQGIKLLDELTTRGFQDRDRKQQAFEERLSAAQNELSKEGDWHQKPTLEERLEAFKDQFKGALYVGKTALAYLGSQMNVEKDDEAGMRKMNKTRFLLDSLLADHPTFYQNDITDLIKSRDELHEAVKKWAQTSQEPILATNYAGIAVLVKELETPQGVKLLNELTQKASQMNDVERQTFEGRITEQKEQLRNRGRG